MQEIVSRKDVVTIRDVAKAAGVSLSSVSRALNGGKNVSAKVARDVAAAANELGYQPDFLARGLRTRSSGMVGCLVPDLANPINAAIVRAAEARLRDAGYMLVVASTANDAARERAAAAQFRGRRLDGVLVAPGSNANDETWRELAAGGTPVIILDRDPLEQDSDPRWPAVLVDHRAGARAATRYLVGLGHRRIALADRRCAHAAEPRAHRGLPRGVRRSRPRSRRRPALRPDLADGFRARRRARPPAQRPAADRHHRARHAYPGRRAAGGARCGADGSRRPLRAVGRRHRSCRGAYAGDHGTALEPRGCRACRRRAAAVAAARRCRRCAIPRPAAGRSGAARASCAPPS